ncbi:alpha/beta fold hydrolase [Nocardia sp. NPDC101769]|uniref:alpha/beta fold hydrolase n=1 Tax=Nocardia sp. NPDC101769 TaxID=3364333 RepID=UPI00382A6786
MPRNAGLRADHAGFGGTGERPAGHSSMRGFAAWVAAFIRAVGIVGPVILIGHSFGGAVAIMTAYDSMPHGPEFGDSRVDASNVSSPKPPASPLADFPRS